jgi:hypothetical protein
LPCADNQFRRMRRDSLENRVPIFGGTADRLTLASVKLSLGVSGLLWVGFVPGVVVAEAEAEAEAAEWGLGLDNHSRSCRSC